MEFTTNQLVNIKENERRLRLEYFLSLEDKDATDYWNNLTNEERIELALDYLYSK